MPRFCPFHFTWSTLWFALLMGCGGSTSGSSGGAAGPTGTIAIGSECRGPDECAPVAGKQIECRCTDSSKKPICTARAAAGESCAITGNFQPACVDGTACVSASFQMPVCVPRAKAGEACTSAPGCEDPYYCDAGGHCAMASAKVGDTCDSFQQTSCVAPYFCPFSGTCTAPAPIGGACDHAAEEGRSQCATGAGCDVFAKMCVAQKPDGADCFHDEECAAGICFFGVCGREPAPSYTTLGCGPL
jgi:hypothetical protein